MRIDSYKKLRNGLYEVAIDAKKYKIYDEIILKYNLLLSKEIDDKTLDQVLSANEEYKSYHDSLKYINIKLKTEKEIRQYLKKKEYNEKIISKTITKLKENNLLDKNLYLTSYINDQINLTNNGPYKIQNNLINLGFREEEINKYLDFKDPIWEDKIKVIINKKTKLNRKLSNNEFKRKIKNDLYLLGYQDNYLEIIESINLDDNKTFETQANKHYEKLKKKYKDNKLSYAFKNKMYSLGYDNELIESYLNKKSE